MSHALSRAIEPSILVAGARSGASAGNAVSLEVLLSAAGGLGRLGTLTHRHRLWPLYTAEDRSEIPQITLGTQPVAVHAEALLAGWLYRLRLRSWSCAWAVNSRYAGALMASGIPYAIWEATTIRDELAVLDIRSIRSAGRGTGAGALLHQAFLPVGDRLEGLLYRGAAVLTAMSEYTRSRMIEIHGLTGSPIQVLLHPPTPAFLQALEEAPRRSGAARSRDRAGIRLLAVGRMDDPRKNFPLLLQAFHLVRDAGQPVTLTVVGPHSIVWRQSPGMQPHEQGITFRGDVPLRDLVRAYIDHDMLIVPSKQEGFGIVVAEALHAGLPVVSTRCGGPEQVLRDSKGGVLVDMNAESLAGAILELARDPARRGQMAESGREFAIQKLSLDTFRAEVATITLGMLRA